MYKKQSQKITKCPSCASPEVTKKGKRETKLELQAWRRDYNEFRPHSSLGNMTPSDFARSLTVRPDKSDY